MPKHHIDMTGQRFNKLTVIHSNEIVGKKTFASLCQCDCGKQVIVSNTALVKLRRKSCGCMCTKFTESLVGQIFGKFTVLERLPNNKDVHGTRWRCQCECGSHRIVTGAHLRNGKRNQCSDCHPNSHRFTRDTTHPEMPMGFWKRLARLAEKRGLEFTVTVDYAWYLFLQQDRRCALSGYPIEFCRVYYSGNPSQTASLDRIDSNLGYREGNVQWVHKKINVMKMDLSDGDFVFWCNNVSMHRRSMLVSKT